MKRIVSLIVALAAASFPVFATGDSEDKVLKIGVAGPHSGDLSAYGIPTVRAAELVTEMYNEKGGVLGRQIELIVEDDVCKPEVATNTAAKLVGDGVAALIGHICSGATKSAMGIYNEAGIPAVSPSSTNPPLTKSGDYPNFLRTIAPDDAQAETVAEYIVGVLGLSKVAVMHDRQDYGKGFADFSVEFLESKGAEVVLYEGITAGDQDYTSVLRKLNRTDAQILVYGGYHPEASKLVQQMAQIDLDIPFISDDGVQGAQFIELARENAEGVYASGPIDTSSNPMAIKASEAHRAKYNEEPGTFFLNAYAAAIVLYEAIEKAGSTDGDAVIAALKSNTFETPLGSIGFDERGDAKGVGFSVYQVVTVPSQNSNVCFGQFFFKIFV